MLDNPASLSRLMAALRSVAMTWGAAPVTSATSAFEISRCWPSSQIAFGYRIGVLADAGDRREHRLVEAGGDGDGGAGSVRGGDDLGVVERRVGLHDHHPAGSESAADGEGVGDEPGRAAGGVRRPTP